ncbi:F0F1 ATP synthase subunit delta [Nocardioides anomalus]|uniref:ATP synthase subunit delta n=1 Tax=Nocardioides anomalus TaxID=2712223 RepID=A0A6G6WES1_9ACTN|nr:F0F1 ATP synthase subunit delta [Nocardioides anomalus]QIG43828.1 F0F1 ATP synthase subunit delta [Nocardioides anomalus]
MLRGASADALAELSQQATGTRTLADAATLGSQLFGVADVVRRDAALRRAMTDSSVEPEAKSGLARAVFGNALDEPALALVADAASRRWISGNDLPDALEQVAVAATVRSAGAQGNQVGDELFSVKQIVAHDVALRGALSDHSRSAADRSALLLGLLGGKTLPATEVLVGQAVTRGRGTVESALQEYLDLAAEALDEGVATVHTARELTADEQQRLVAALKKQYARDIQLHVVVDPELIGGLRVEIGDDVIDGTVANRLDDARRRLAG